MSILAMIGAVFLCVIFWRGIMVLLTLGAFVIMCAVSAGVLLL